MLSDIGYSLSVVSVFLLAVPAWHDAVHDPKQLACLIGGVTLSIIGMALRWRSHRNLARLHKTG